MATVVYVGPKPETRVVASLRASVPGARLLVVTADDPPDGLSAVEWVNCDIATLEGQGRTLDLLRQREPVVAFHLALPFAPGVEDQSVEKFLQRGVGAAALLVRAAIGLMSPVPGAGITLIASQGHHPQCYAINAYWRVWLEQENPTVPVVMTDP